MQMSPCEQLQSKDISTIGIMAFCEGVVSALNPQLINALGFHFPVPSTELQNIRHPQWHIDNLASHPWCKACSGNLKKQRTM